MANKTTDVKAILKLLEVNQYKTLKPLEIPRKRKNKRGTRKPQFPEGLKVTKSIQGSQKRPCIDFTFGYKTQIKGGNYVSIIKLSEDSLVFVIHNNDTIPENGYLVSISENTNREYAFCVKVCNDEGVELLEKNIGTYRLYYKESNSGDKYILAIKQTTPIELI